MPSAEILAASADLEGIPAAQALGVVHVVLRLIVYENDGNLGRIFAGMTQPAKVVDISLRCLVMARYFSWRGHLGERAGGYGHGDDTKNQDQA